MTNGSIVMLMGAQIRRLHKQIRAGEDLSDLHHLHDLADAAAGLALAIRDRIGPSKDAYTNASQGGP